MRFFRNNWAKIGLTALAALVASPSVRAAGTLIVDSKGALVGLLDSQDRAYRQLSDGQWVEFLVEVGGLQIGPIPSFLYTSKNCTGTRYLDASALPTVGYLLSTAKAGPVATGTLYYAHLPFQLLSFFSEKAPTGPCFPFTNSVFDFAGVAQSVKLSFSPPFSIK
jgi:hypothetical protein